MALLPSRPTDSFAGTPGGAAAGIHSIGIVGAGTMGAGIAQAAAQAGFTVRLYDVEDRFLDRGRNTIEDSLTRFVERGRLPAEARDAALGRLSFSTDLGLFRDCDLVVEAVPEQLDLKREIFSKVDAIVGPAAVLASNTSSLSVTDLAAGTGRPDRFVGLHFFNPPVLMKLVEVVRAETTSPETVALTQDLARRMGKVPVTCKDTPGFIVNRVARPFYLQGMQAFGEGLGSVDEVDAVARGLGFPMGPFQLMDLIGLDVNLSVTRSVWEQRFMEPRLRPHPVQEGLVRAGCFGRKSGTGFYSYGADPATPAVHRDPGAPRLSGPHFDWTRWHPHVGAPAHAQIAARLLSSLVNEAYFALGEGVASASDIDTGVKLGTNYPRGLVEWGDALGLDLVLETLDVLEAWYRDGRYAAAPLLRQQAS
ncbi:MAG: 3-hydroxybutyryl-CoA dehydrogenase [Chloroflexi bacterium]|nr:3-hydroxybutyryl-CoA dehydrogenase [Chloroflexota bacterium]